MRLKTDQDKLEANDLALRDDVDPLSALFDISVAKVPKGHYYIGWMISDLRSVGAITGKYVIWSPGPAEPRRLPLNKIFSAPLPLP